MKNQKLVQQLDVYVDLQDGLRQVASDFKQVEQCLIRHEVSKEKILTCSSTIKQYIAVEIDPKHEMAELAKLQSEQALLEQRLPGLVTEFRLALRDRLQQS